MVFWPFTSPSHPPRSLRSSLTPHTTLSSSSRPSWLCLAPHRCLVTAPPSAPLRHPTPRSTRSPESKLRCRDFNGARLRVCPPSPSPFNQVARVLLTPLSSRSPSSLLRRGLRAHCRLATFSTTVRLYQCLAPHRRLVTRHLRGLSGTSTTHPRLPPFAIQCRVQPGRLSLALLRLQRRTPARLPLCLPSFPSWSLCCHGLPRWYLVTTFIVVASPISLSF